MLRHIFIAAALVGAALPAAAQTWTELNNSGTFPGVAGAGAGAQVPNVEVGNDDRPVVAWQQPYAGVSAVKLRKWDTVTLSWKELAGSATNEGVSTGTGAITSNVQLRWMVVDSAGNPSVAWIGKVPGTTQNSVYFKRWNSLTQQWTALGGSASGTGLGAAPGQAYAVLALDPSGNPTIAWISITNFLLGGDLFLKQWNAQQQQWVGVGGSESGTAITTVKTGTSLALAVDGQNRVCVAFSAGVFGSTGPCFRFWTGTYWGDLNNSGVPGTLSTLASCGNLGLRLGAASAPYLCWTALPAGGGVQQVYAKYWNVGTNQWAELDGSGSGLGISLNGGSGSSISSHPSMVLDAFSRPMIAWTHRDLQVAPELSVFVKRWTGNSWVEIDGSATSPALGATTLSLQNSSIALNAAGTIYVGWRKWDSGNSNDSEIYLRTHVPPPPTIATLAQFRLDGTTAIPAGGITWGDAGFTASAMIAPGVGGDVHLEVEARAVGTVFSGTATSSSPAFQTSATVALAIGNQAMGTQLHWQARAVSAAGQASSWLPFGGGAVDAWVRDNAVPSLPTAGQFDVDGSQALPKGARVFDTGSFQVTGAATDSDSDAWYLEVELRREGEAFTGQPSATGPIVTGGTSTLEVPTSGAGPYRWKVRAADTFGGMSAWTSPMAGSGPDFVVVVFGSLGGPLCSAWGSTDVILLLMGISALASLGAAGARRAPPRPPSGRDDSRGGA